MLMWCTMESGPPCEPGSGYKREQLHTNPHFLRYHTNTRVLCFLLFLVGASWAGGGLSRSTETLHPHQRHCKREREIAVWMCRGEIATQEEMEIVNEGGRGGVVKSKRRRQGGWRGRKRVDPLWLRKLRLKLQQKTADSAPHHQNGEFHTHTLRGWVGGWEGELGDQVRG